MKTMISKTVNRLRDMFPQDRDVLEARDVKVVIDASIYWPADPNDPTSEARSAPCTVVPWESNSQLVGQIDGAGTYDLVVDGEIVDTVDTGYAPVEQPCTAKQLANGECSRYILSNSPLVILPGGGPYRMTV